MEQYPSGFFRSADLTHMVERYMCETDVRKVYDAFILAAEAHNGVIRKSGEPYITHPLEVAGILADLHMDADTVCAALLHDVLEDTPYEKSALVDQFGEAVGEMVDGVTKLEKSSIYSTKQEVVIASFQKMMLAMTEDFRVVLIKLADRLHNMRTLGSMKAEARKRIALETFAIYIPLARRMGMNAIRRELQFLAFQSLHPWRARVLEKAVNHYYSDNRIKHTEILDNISNAVLAGLTGSSVFAWEKNLFKVYERMKLEGVDFDSKKEMLEIRVLVRARQDCYAALGIVHGMYHPQVEKFRDYIANPKTYGFQALQTVLLTPSRQLVRVLIQTRDMYQVAQYGIAAQWRFPDIHTQQAGNNITQSALSRWLEQVRELEGQSENPLEFFSYMQSDLNLSEITAFTPKGEVKEFPQGATLVDFAYAIHTEVGHHCVGALVDGVERPLRALIPNTMPVIEIITDPNATPQPSWLNFVSTARAKSNIQGWLRRQTDEERLALGKQRLDISLHGRGSSLEQVDAERLQDVLGTLGYADTAAFFSAIGQGEQCSKLMAERLLGRMQSIESVRTDVPLIIKGTSGLLVKMATCCLPVPKEAILARQHDNGLEIHRFDCHVVNKTENDADILAVAWAEDVQTQQFTAGLLLEVHDVRGMLFQITRLLDVLDINIHDLSITGEGRIKQDTLIIQVRDINHLQEVMRQLKHIPNVLTVNRLTRKDLHEQNYHFHD